MSILSVSGLSSGVDWRSVIDELMAVERRPIELLEQRQAALTEERSVWEQISTKLQGLEDALAALEEDDTFQARTATVSDETKLTASVTSDAVIGSYRITITQLALAHSVASDQQASSSEALGLEGQFQINGVAVTVSAADSLSDIRDAINTADAGVTATVVDQRLIITRNETGSTEISFTDPDGVLKALGVLEVDDTPKHTLQPAQDAVFTVNGLTVTRSSNTVSDVLSGITLELKAPTDSEVIIEVVHDTEVAVEAVKSFIEAYNDLLSLLRNELGEEGKLRGDPTAARMATTLRRMVSDRVAGIEGAYESLAEIGVTTMDRRGDLNLDEEKLREALSADPASVQVLFSHSSDDIVGVAERLAAFCDTWGDSVDGLIAARTEGIDARLRDLSEQIGNMEYRLTLKEAQLVRQFTALETALSVMQSQALWLTGQISALLGSWST